MTMTKCWAPLAVVTVWAACSSGREPGDASEPDDSATPPSESGCAQNEVMVNLVCRLSCNDDLGCAQNGTCKEVAGTKFCDCKPGFFGDGISCAELNECTDGTHDCGQNATCSNTPPGSFSCRCDAGYEGDGRTCSDINECLGAVDNDCPDNSRCIDQPGDYDCACLSGFEPVAGECRDIDECAAGTAGCAAEQRCANQPGTFECQTLGSAIAVRSFGEKTMESIPFTETMRSTHTLMLWLQPEQTMGLATPLTTVVSANEHYWLGFKEGFLDVRFQVVGDLDYTTLKSPVDPSLSSTSWYHLALVYDYGRAELYLDGVRVAQREQNGPLPITVQGQMTLALGQTQFGQFRGLIDEFLLFERALTADDVAHYYNDGLGRPATSADTGLKYGWHFDEAVVNNWSFNDGQGKPQNFAGPLISPYTGSGSTRWQNWARGVVPLR